MNPIYIANFSSVDGAMLISWIERFDGIGEAIGRYNAHLSTFLTLGAKSVDADQNIVYELLDGCTVLDIFTFEFAGQLGHTVIYK